MAVKSELLLRERPRWEGKSQATSVYVRCQFGHGTCAVMRLRMNGPSLHVAWSFHEKPHMRISTCTSAALSLEVEIQLLNSSRIDPEEQRRRRGSANNHESSHFSNRFSEYGSASPTAAMGEMRELERA